jgi:hypothetical protein
MQAKQQACPVYAYIAYLVYVSVYALAYVYSAV